MATKKELAQRVYELEQKYEDLRYKIELMQPTVQDLEVMRQRWHEVENAKAKIAKTAPIDPVKLREKTKSVLDEKVLTAKDLAKKEIEWLNKESIKSADEGKFTADYWWSFGWAEELNVDSDYFLTAIADILRAAGYKDIYFIHDGLFEGIKGFGIKWSWGLSW